MTRPGFERHALKPRYDVPSIQEDAWHCYSGQRTTEIVSQALAQSDTRCNRLLNAGSGCHRLQFASWEEVAIDLFPIPLLTHPLAVCASIERLPFQSESFGAAVCVGEVLAYCDPAQALKELARVLTPRGVLICDFGSSRSFKYRFTHSFGRAADLVVDSYNGLPENIWIYDPRYVKSVLEDLGLEISLEIGIHGWSAAARRLGLSPLLSVTIERYLRWAPLPASCSDIMTFVARRTTTST